MAMKKVGGPAMNVTRSCSTSDRACSGSKRRTSTARIPEAPGTSTPLSSPETWAIGAGISTASAGPSPCTRVISAAFQLSPRWVCSTALGVPVEPDVNSTNATSEVRAGQAAAGTGSPPRASVSAVGSDRASCSSSTTRRGPTWVSAASTSERPKECSTGAATAPRRQHALVSTMAARLLGSCQATVSPGRTPRVRRPPETVATSALAPAALSRASPSTTSPAWAVRSASRVGTSQAAPGCR